jgi:hypothetical protein
VYGLISQLNGLAERHLLRLKRLEGKRLKKRVELDEVSRKAEEYAQQKFQDGLETGLLVAEKIIGWLTMQPETKRQKQVREWAEKEIEKTKERFVMK